jgi:putative MATE family efflux protein
MNHEQEDGMAAVADFRTNQPTAVKSRDSDPPARSGTQKLAALLDGPIIIPLLKLALPTVTVLVVQTFVSVAETYFVSRLGTDAVAGVSLVIPVLMLMTMMSNGAIGGGVSSATARALGSGRKAQADAILLHALVLALVFGLAFTVAVIGGGTMIYRALGGTGEALNAALHYSMFVFGGAILGWLVNLISASLRGAGDVKTPAMVTLMGAVIVVPLSPALIFGWGPLPGFGIAGAGMAVVAYYAIATGVLIIYLRSAQSPLRLSFAPLQWRLFKDILGVGAVSAIGTLQINLMVAVLTSLVGMFGTQALAGFGLASRLDYLLIPLLFGLGTATVTMVGANIGAGNIFRARRIAWTSALFASAVLEVIGVLAALFPQAWIGIFSSDPAINAVGAQYLRIVGPFYGFVGLGMLLYFASQGAGSVGLPVLAGTVRLIVTVGAGWLALTIWKSDLAPLFGVVSLASVTFGVLVALSMRSASWGRSSGSRKSWSMWARNSGNRRSQSTMTA